MILSRVAREVLPPRAKARRYRIRLKISPAAREDAWEICRVALNYGVEVQDCCFAFANEEQYLNALETLRLRFGPEYFEAVEPLESHHE